MKTKSQKTVKAGLQSRPEQVSTETRPQINLALRRANRQLDTDSFLALLQKDAPEFFAKVEIVGQWAWLQFAEKQPPTVTTVLSQLGFHWNNIRQVWQHPCGTIADDRASYDPRTRYGSYFPATAKAA